MGGYDEAATAGGLLATSPGFSPVHDIPGRPPPPGILQGGSPWESELRAPGRLEGMGYRGVLLLGPSCPKMTDSSRPPRFHVVSAWHDPPSPEVGRRAEVARPQAPVESPPAETPRVLSAAPAGPDPSTVLPQGAGAGAPPPSTPGPGLYDLPGLLTRIWSAPRHDPPALGRPSGAERRPDPPLEEVRSRLDPSAYAPYQVPERPAFLSPEAFASPLPRRTRPWICPGCQLPNAPWSKECTSCRTAAP